MQQSRKKIASEKPKTQRKTTPRKCPVLTRKLVLIDKLIQNLKWYYSEVLMLENFYTPPNYPVEKVGRYPVPRWRDKLKYLGEIKESPLPMTEILKAQDKIAKMLFYKIPEDRGAERTRKVNIHLFAIRNFYQQLQDGQGSDLDTCERKFNFALLTLNDWVHAGIADFFRYRSWDQHYDKKVYKTRLHRASVLGKKKKTDAKANLVNAWLSQNTDNSFTALSGRKKARQFKNYLAATNDQTTLDLWGVKNDSKGNRIIILNLKKFVESYLNPTKKKRYPIKKKAPVVT